MRREHKTDGKRITEGLDRKRIANSTRVAKE